MIIIENFSLKTLFKVTERDFLKKKNGIILIKLCLFELVIKELFIFKKIKNIDNRLIMFIEVKNVNDFLICLLSCDSNKSDMILFINVIFENVKGEVCEFEMRFRICATRASIKPQISISKKTIILTFLILPVNLLLTTKKDFFE